MSHKREILNTMHALPILVVDDDPISRLVIEKSLQDFGFTHVKSVENGSQAIIHIKTYPPELVILDIFMPELNGFECCQWIRSQRNLHDLPVLMLTSATDELLRQQSFDAGATDFVCKPLQPDELYARVRIHLQNRIMLKDLRMYKARLEKEMQCARELQFSVLPTAKDVEQARTHCKLDIASHLNTSSEIGGDFWGLKHLYTNELTLWMVDFSGHGMAAALNAFRFQSYLHEHSSVETRPGPYLDELNDKLIKLLMRGQFATMFYCNINSSNNSLDYACACSPHPLLLRKGGTVDKLDGCGTPLGICEQTYPTNSISFNPGDTLVLYSDALIETPDSDGNYISEEMLTALISEHKNGSAAVIRDQMLEYFQEHSKAPLADDLTFCICRYMD